MDSIGEVSGAGKECYPGTNIERPNRLDGGGRGTYCCVPECKSARYNHLWGPSHIGMFTLPKNNPTRKQWIEQTSIEFVFKYPSAMNRRPRLSVFEIGSPFALYLCLTTDGASLFL